MKIVAVKEKVISGMSVRTTNEREMNVKTAKIGAIVQRFDNAVSVDYKRGARVHNVYFNYESDASGEYTMMAGADSVESTKERLETVTIQAGNYMVFSAEGEVPEIVYTTWSKIWDYFSNEDVSHQRAYTTDFECYKSETEIEIHIAVE
ncbi:hypothetical protein A9Q99_10445 [Gammaproteobacteria bacterium 45_16_T64]|nr:hypothetical protein A9Q99_10445 [Gammaproteobacteria bacterium 45_16_T64]